MNKEEIINKSLVSFYHGSNTYKVLKTDKSDYDIISVVEVDFFNELKNKLLEHNQLIFKEKNNIYNIEVISEDVFIEMLETTHMIAVEFMFLPSEYIIKGEFMRTSFKDYFTLDNLRHTVSHITSNSYVKCKKKLIKDSPDYNPYIAVKSMFHAMRVAMFGIQIGHYGEIRDYTCANFIWNDLVLGKVYDWEEIVKRYKPFRNALMTEFRRLVDKNENR